MNNTRRKFLLRGSMATAALLTAKPFTSIANCLSPVTGYYINNNNLVLVHTGNNTAAGHQLNIQDVARLKNNAANLLLLHAGNVLANNQATTVYDASMKQGEAYSVAADDYKIIYKGDIKTGVISADTNSIDKLNDLAVYLKEEKNCHLVVCMSQLGYKSNTGLDDLTLAAGSTHLDIIIGGHAENFCKQPVIAQNKNKQEVIINHTAASCLALRKIEIGFNSRGKKMQIALTKTI